MTQGSLQAALPREMYVDERTWLRERDTVLFGQWYCVGRLDDHILYRIGRYTPLRIPDPVDQSSAGDHRDERCFG